MRWTSSDGISAMPPALYADRFRTFVSHEVSIKMMMTMMILMMMMMMTMIMMVIKMMMMMILMIMMTTTMMTIPAR